MRTNFTFFALLLSTFLVAQSKVFNGAQLKNVNYSELNDQFQKYQVYEIDIANLNNYVKNESFEVQLTMLLGNQYQWDISIYPRELRAKDYLLTSWTPKGKQFLPKSEIKTYQGNLNAKGGGSVSLTIDEDFIRGYVRKNGEYYYIEPVYYFKKGVPSNQFVVYAAEDVKPSGGTCGAMELVENKEKYLQQMTEEQPEKSSVLLCYDIEIAIASDASMFTKYGSIAAVENHNVSVMNDVQTNFDDEFQHELSFVIVEQFIVSPPATDPWTAALGAGTLLNSFTAWGPGGFTATHDIASLWTNRNFTGSTIGIAWLSSVCTNNRYHCLQDFTGNANLLRVLTAHEIGHNFSAGHDSGGSGFIMAPAVNNTNTWSAASVNSINNHVNSRNCLSICAPPVPPVALFSPNFPIICPGSMVTMIDNSLNSPDTWSWTMPGATPSSSTDQNPTVVYNNPGSYNVTLTASNANGSASSNGTIIVGPGGTDFFFYEDFEGGLFAQGWTLDNPDGAATWVTTSNPFTQYGDEVLWVNNFNYNAAGQRDAIISPTLDFSGRSFITFEMDYAYARYSNNFKDSLVIQVSTNGGLSYNYVFNQTENGGGNFATVPQTTQAFTPDANPDWCYQTTFGPGCISLDLSAFAGSSDVKIKIENVTGYGNNMYIDNIKLTSDCQLLLPPVALFAANVTTDCSPMIVLFEDLSLNSPESWSWTFPGGFPATSTDPSPLVVYNTPGIYDVTLSTTNQIGSNSLTIPGYITVLGTPFANYTQTTTGLTASFTDLSSGVPTTYSWDFGDGNTSSLPNPNHTYQECGEYIVTLSVINICGANLYSDVISVYDTPTANFSQDVSTGCAPLTIQFTDMSDCPQNYEWFFENGTPSTSTDPNPSITFDIPGSHNVTLTVTNPAGSDTYTTIIDIDDAPTTDFNSIINGLNADFISLASANATSHFWDFGDGNTSSDIDPSHPYMDCGTYTVSLTVDNDCGTESITETIDVYEFPQADFQPSVLVGCGPISIEFFDNSYCADEYNWNFNGGNPSTSTAQSPIISYNTPGLYDVSLTVTNPLGQHTYTTSVEILDTPTAGFSNAINGLSAAFINSSANGGTYSWNFGDGNTSNEQDPTNEYMECGDYTVSLTVSNDCGSDTFVESISVYELPTANYSQSVNSGCGPLNVLFSDQSDCAVSYSWTFDGGNPSTSSQSNPSVDFDTPGTYNVELTVTNPLGTDTYATTIEVLEPPVAGFTNSGTGLNFAFTNASTNGSTYSWNFGDGNSSTEPSPNHVYDDCGDYTVSMTVNNDCGTDTFTEMVSAYDTPVASFNPSTSAGCGPLDIQFTDNSDCADTYEWTFENGNPSTSSDPNPLVSFSTSGVQDVSLTVTNPLGQHTTSMTVEVFDIPTASFSNTTAGLISTFSNNSIGGGTYAWDFGDGNFSSEPNPAHNFEECGDYTVSLTVTNDCGTATSSQAIAAWVDPTANFNANTLAGCGPLAITFSDLSDCAETYEWTFENGTPSTSNDQNPPEVTFTESGPHDVTLIVTNSVGQHTYSMSIEVNEDPAANFSSNLTGLDASFTNNSTGGGNYFWTFGDGNSSTEPNPNYTYEDCGEYTVFLTVTNDCGEDTFTENVSAWVNPTASFAPNSSVGCGPLAVQFTNSSECSETYEWTFENGNPATFTGVTPPEVMFENLGNHAVTLTVSNPIGTHTETMSIEVIGEPSADFSTVQNGMTINFTDNSNAATSYLWDFGDGMTSTEPSPNHPFDECGEYSVSLTVTNDCGESTIVQNISVWVIPTSDFTLDTDIGCSPLAIQFSNQSNCGETYEWSFENGNPATSTNFAPGNVNFTNLGIHQVSLIVSNPAGQSTFSMEIEVLEEPTAAYSATNNGMTINFTSNSSNASTYLWDFGNNMTSAEPNPEITFEECGDYPVSLTVTNDCGEDTFIENIGVWVLPTVTYNASANIGCGPLSVQFENLTECGVEYEWTFENGMPAAYIGHTPPAIIFNNPGMQTVSLTAINPIGQTMQTMEIEVLDTPTANFTSSSIGLATTFTNNSTNGTSYLWDFGDTNTSAEPNPTHVFNASGEYTVTLTVTNDCGTATFTEIITVENQPPTANFTADLTVGCIPFEVQFTSLASANATTIEWAFEGGFPATSMELNPIVVFNSPGMFNVTMSASNDAGMDVLTIENYIEVGEAPTAAFTSSINSNIVSFSNNSIGQISEVLWNFGDMNTSTVFEPVHEYGTPGVFTVTLMVTNQCGTHTFSDQVIIEGELPTAAFDGDPRDGCVPFEVQFTDLSSGNPNGWNWQVTGPENFSSSDQNPSFVFTVPGSYDVNLEVTNIVGTNQLISSQYINAQDIPTAGFTPNANGGTVNFVNNSIGATQFFWDFGDNNTSAQSGPSHTYQSSGDFEVSLIAINDCGVDTSIQTISIVIDNLVEIPGISEFNVFPNPNDGQFTLILQGNAIPNLDLNFYNVLGQQLLHESVSFSSGNLTKVFDFAEVPTGVYVLQISTGDKALYKKVIIE